MKQGGKVVGAEDWHILISVFRAMQSPEMSLEHDHGSEQLGQSGSESHHQRGGQGAEGWGLCCKVCPQ